MDGAARAFASPAEIEIDGRTHEVRALVGEMYGAIEQKILSLRPDPFAIAKEKMALFDDMPEAQTQLLKIAMEEARAVKSVAGAEAKAWCNSLDGTAFTVWLTIKHNEDPLTAEQVKAWLLRQIGEMVDAIAEAEKVNRAVAQEAATDKVLTGVHDIVNQASGEDLRGN